MNSLQKKRNKRTLARNVITCLFVALILSMMTVNVFAATVEWKPPPGSGMGARDYIPSSDGILHNQGLGKVINIIMTVADSAAVIAVAFYLTQLIFSTSSRTAESSLSAIKTTVISFVLLNCLQIIVRFAIVTAGGHFYQFS